MEIEGVQICLWLYIPNVDTAKNLFIIMLMFETEREIFCYWYLILLQNIKVNAVYFKKAILWDDTLDSQGRKVFFYQSPDQKYQWLLDNF